MTLIRKSGGDFETKSGNVVDKKSILEKAIREAEAEFYKTFERAHKIRQKILELKRTLTELDYMS